MRPPVPAAEVRRQMAAVLELDGARHADVAAGVLAARGRSGLDAATFASRCGVPEAVLAAAEAGELARDQLPGALRQLVPAAG